MGAKFQDFIARHVVMTVPDEMDACQECLQTTCEAARYDACAYRLNRLSALREAREANCVGAGPVQPLEEILEE